MLDIQLLVSRRLLLQEFIVLKAQELTGESEI
jgi:hypothetical protein